MPRCTVASMLLVTLALLTGCRPVPQPHTLTFLIESSPNNLDVRQGTDSQSERIGELIYDPLVRKDAHFNLQPWLASSWNAPIPSPGSSIFAPVSSSTMAIRLPPRTLRGPSAV